MSDGNSHFLMALGRVDGGLAIETTANWPSWCRCTRRTFGFGNRSRRIASMPSPATANLNCRSITWANRCD